MVFNWSEAICKAEEENKVIKVKREKRHRVKKGYVKLDEDFYFYFKEEYDREMTKCSECRFAKECLHGWDFDFSKCPDFNKLPF